MSKKQKKRLNCNLLPVLCFLSLWQMAEVPITLFSLSGIGRKVFHCPQELKGVCIIVKKQEVVSIGAVARKFTI